jgi:hypothetical protein
VLSGHAKHANVAFTPSTREAFDSDLTGFTTGKGRLPSLDQPDRGHGRHGGEPAAEVEQLRARLADPTSVGELARKAAEYDALMRTKTMRLLAYPRVRWSRLLAARDAWRSRQG